MATAAERRAARKALEQKNKVEGQTDKVIKEKEAVHAAAPEEDRPSKTVSRNTVTVACKIPNGLILQNHVLDDGFEPVFGGGSRPIKVARPVGNPIKLIGPARPFGADPEMKRVVGGYGLTHNVPKNDWDKWLKDNAELDMVKNGLIFAHDSPDNTAAQARDMRTTRSGLEALNTESKDASGKYTDPRMPRNIKKFNPNDDSTDISKVA